MLHTGPEIYPIDYPINTPSFRRADNRVLSGVPGQQEQAKQESVLLKKEADDLGRGVGIKYSEIVTSQSLNRQEQSAQLGKLKEEILSFWNKHPEAVNQAMVNILTQILRVELGGGSREQYEALLALNRKNLPKELYKQYLLMLISLAELIGDDTYLGVLRGELEAIKK